MKNMIKHGFAMLFLTLVFGALSTQTLNAQGTATNCSGESWTINYYGTITTIPKNCTATSFTEGTICSAGISVYPTISSGTCINFFTTSPSTWNPTCTILTTSVQFSATAAVNCPFFGSSAFLFN